MKRVICASAVPLIIAGALFAQTASRRTSGAGGLAPGYWPLEKSQAIIEKMQTVRLAPELSHLTAGERAAVAKLLEVGQIFQELYEEQLHAEALSSHRELQALDRRLGHAAATANLLTLYRLNQGPIATTLENKRETFLPVKPRQVGSNMYPAGVSKEEIEAFLTAHPEKRASIMDLRSVVRRSTTESLRRDLMKLRQYPVLATLHPGLQAELTGLLAGRAPKGFYSVPYSVAYADKLIRAHGLLNEAADLLEKDDEEFARYLRNRSRDLLSDDYESGDAAWVTGRFKHLNAQIGSYEVYADDLYGVKTFFAFSLLSTRQQETEALRQAMKGLQALEDSLPYEHHKKVREDIPVGVYDVVADFGQARGGNTATILPNESYLARRYGRTILLRSNIMRNPDLFGGTSRRWEAAVGEPHRQELTSEGNFYRTLWHEVGHYLGVDLTKDGRDLDVALQENSSAMEEMKADLVSLFVAEALRKQGYYTAEQLRAVYASGVLRVLQNNRPRRDQPYNTMQLMQWNFFMENGLLAFDRQTGKLRINYDKYHTVIGKLLAKVLEVQYQGDKAASDQFIEQYTKWDEDLHGVVAKNIREQQRYRFQLFKYAALGE
ncbi:MAG TPA: zincin-like metallopeptidase domain-containing protein [Pyrinomonadaceae bacterium]|nr:zincin-like metallopeptidase domain-containing protein [Pyrinomonadaceae bacterium]